MWIGFLNSRGRNAFLTGLIDCTLAGKWGTILKSRPVWLLIPDQPLFCNFPLFLLFGLVSFPNHACFALLFLLLILFTEFKDGVFFLPFLIHCLSRK